LPDGFSIPAEEYRYFICADRFGWTPEQVDEQSAVKLDWILRIAGVVDEVKEAEIERSRRG
jgi:hypothetical protein